MITSTHTTSDIELRDAVLKQLEWAPQVDAGGIGVAASDQAVTLTGFIDTYAGKLAAERAAKQVHGVRAVANDIQVRLRLEHADDDIARAAAHALSLRVGLPDSVQAVVHHGHVTLTGDVPWLFHRTNAERAIHRIPGILTITNRIVVTPTVASPGDVMQRITDALHRVADLNARHISVVIKGNTVMLSGQVTSWAQRDAAELAAAAAPGIGYVENRLEVAPGPRQAVLAGST